jgi:hypothetical protein
VPGFGPACKHVAAKYGAPPRSHLYQRAAKVILGECWLRQRRFEGGECGGGTLRFPIYHLPALVAEGELGVGRLSARRGFDLA